MDKSGHEPCVQFLLDIAKTAIRDISGNPDVNITRVASMPNVEKIMLLLQQMPYVTGCEFVNTNWLMAVYSEIAVIFNAEFAEYTESLEDYVRAKDKER